MAQQTGKFDRATQWMFIACLPFVPYLIWSFVRVRGRVYRLDDEGTLSRPRESGPGLPGRQKKAGGGP